MITAKQLKETAIKLIKEKNFDEKCQAKIAMMLFSLADQIEFLEEKNAVSDSQIGLLNTISDTWRDDSLQMQHKLQDDQEVIAELRKQIAILKEALMK
jgi:hypothetical protein